VLALVVPTDEELLIARDTPRGSSPPVTAAGRCREEDQMARSLLIAPAADDVGLARTCLGILRALDRRGVKVAYVKPVAQPRPDGGPDRSAALVAAVTALRPPEPLSTAELEQLLGAGGLDVILEKIVAAWEPVYAASEVVVVEGLSTGPSKLYASSLNQALARALDADVVLADSWRPDADADAVAEQFAIAAAGYTASGEQTRVAGCMVHRLPGTDAAAVADLRAALAGRRLRLIAGVPRRPALTWPRVLDLVRGLHPQVLHEGDLSRRIRDVAVFAQGIPGGIRVLDPGRLVVVPGDRHEVIMAAYLAELSGTHLAALLLSAGTAPDPRISALTRATMATGLPVLLVDQDSYHTATRVRDLDPGLPVDDTDRIEAVTSNIADALDVSWLQSLTGSARPRRLSPAAFRYQLVELPAPPTHSSCCPRAPSRAPCGPRLPAPSGASPAACCSDTRTRWPESPAASASSCPMASRWSIPRPSPNATSPRWPSCVSIRAGPGTWPGSISLTPLWSAP
jgi:phosphate acetyltransferase